MSPAIDFHFIVTIDDSLFAHAVYFVVFVFGAGCDDACSIAGVALMLYGNHVIQNPRT